MQDRRHVTDATELPLQRVDDDERDCLPGESRADDGFAAGYIDLLRRLKFRKLSGFFELRVLRRCRLLRCAELFPNFERIAVLGVDAKMLEPRGTFPTRQTRQR